ncbi:baseplate J/gp47 family protein [uncultured Novosphingobium sp.]|uniref:baseplate J/gp47 family protein n=1 Tax=uncultured Novosphingobium sp. TaxID=292277 RepID=UPI0025958F65|nr:baseplate J/gp47 family protein [uncultured Novosphingobium sp.]
MVFSRPTLTSLRSQVAADIAAGLPGLNALLRYNNLNILGDVEAGLVDGCYGYLDWITQQSVPFTSEDEFLEGWAALKGVTRKPAVAATGNVTLNGTGGIVPAGTALTRSDGANFTVDADVELVGGVAVVAVTAIATGAASNTVLGTTLSLAAAISGVNSLGTVSAAISGGSDVERDDDLRTRMITEYSRPASGGSANDYVNWALSIPGVTRAWCERNVFGSGTVGVLFMMDDVRAEHGGFPQGTNGVASAETRGTPATGDQLIIANALFELQPVGPIVFGRACTANTVNLTIAGIADATDTTKTAIAAAFAAALLSTAIPGGSTPLSAIEGKIAAVSGATGFVITAISASAGAVTPGPTGNISSNLGALPVAGNITYV